MTLLPRALLWTRTDTAGSEHVLFDDRRGLVARARRSPSIPTAEQGQLDAHEPGIEDPVVRAEQTYTVLSQNAVRFASDNFEADIELDEHGFVTN
jgi:hypothetical protein